MGGIGGPHWGGGIVGQVGGGVRGGQVRMLGRQRQGAGGEVGWCAGAEGWVGWCAGWGRGARAGGGRQGVVTQVHHSWGHPVLYCA